MTAARRGASPPRGRRRPPRKPTMPPIDVDALARQPPIALVVAVVLTAILEVLDITIVSVAIPHMLGLRSAPPPIRSAGCSPPTSSPPPW